MDKGRKPCHAGSHLDPVGGPVKESCASLRRLVFHPLSGPTGVARLEDKDGFGVSRQDECVSKNALFSVEVGHGHEFAWRHVLARACREQHGLHSLRKVGDGALETHVWPPY